ncbi:hypothetical protein FRB96_002449 [Tulasnella sp. 330]|nr:hypothetical protein FRB96_002449 [Tulasnella sp. 330]
MKEVAAVHVFVTRTTLVATPIQSILARESILMVKISPTSMKFDGSSKTEISNIELSYSLPGFVEWLAKVPPSIEQPEYFDPFVEGYGPSEHGALPFDITSRVRKLAFGGSLGVVKEWVNYLARPVLMGQTARFPLPHVQVFYW